MTSKAYLVSWLGKGNIVWTPLEQTQGGLNLSSISTGPLRNILDAGAANSDALKSIQKMLDPSMALLNSVHTTVQVTAGLAAASVGLQIAVLVAVYRLSQKVERIDQKVKEIGGKFELHFLDRSLDHFLQWHQGVAGLVPSAAVALEEDCYIALQELFENRNLKIPAYLKLKLLSVAEALDAYSRFLYAVIHNVSIPVLGNDRIKAWIQEGKSIQRTAPVGGFISQNSVLTAWMEQLKVDPKWKPEDDGTLLSKSLSRNIIDRTHPVSLLALHVTQALSLINSLEDQVQKSPELSMIVRVA